MLRSNSPFFRGRRAALRMLPASVSCSCSALLARIDPVVAEDMTTAVQTSPRVARGGGHGAV